MNRYYLMAMLLFAGALTGCGGESDSSAPDLVINLETPEDPGGEAPTDEIINTPLPVIEDFDTANDLPGFFSASYKALASESADDIEDVFYYPTNGLLLSDGTFEPSTSMWITGDADPKMRLGNGRFSIGQTVSVLAADSEDPRANSTPGDGADELISWGELDLSEPYKISFCVVAASTGGLMQVYVDNNTTGEANSIHGGGASGSRIFNVSPGAMVPGQRVKINIPGDTTVMPDATPIDSKTELVGTPNSFLQLRVDSGGYVVFDDLLIELQSDAGNNPPPDCSTKTTDYALSETGDGDIPVTGTPFSGLPLNVDLSVDKDTFFGSGESPGFLAMSDDNADPFYKVTGGNSGIAISDEKISLANARFTIGDKGTPTTDSIQPDGNIDLSEPYRITIVISEFTDANPEDDPGAFQVYVDNNTTGSGNSIHGSDSKLSEIDADGSLTLPYTLVIDSDLGTANSFLQIRADSRVGSLVIDSISIESQVPPETVLEEDFSAADTDTFFSADYKSRPGDASSPLYVSTGGQSNTVLGDGTLVMNNARFTIGDTGVATTAETQPAGTLNLSTGWTIRFTVLDFSSVDPGDPGKFQVYVDNNTTSSGSSIHGGDSKILEVADGDGAIAAFPHEVSVSSSLGTANSFIQIRADSRVATLVIDDLVIEYQ